MKLFRQPYCFLLIVSFVFAASGESILAQETPEKPRLTSDAKTARTFSLAILDEMKDILKEHYFDQKFHGIDLKARVEGAKARVKTLEYNWQMYRVLAQVLLDLDDSHTRLTLPSRSDHFQYGLGWQMIGQDCFVIWVKKDSDARAQGIEVGDQILQIGRFTPTRADLWKMNYVIYRLDPSRQLSLRVRKPDGSERTVTIVARTQTDKEFEAELKARKEKAKAKEKEKGKDNEKSDYFKCQEIESDLVACKLYSFVVEKSVIDKMMKQARKYPKLILDFRRNGGGYVSIEEYVSSHFFDKIVKIADVRTKEKTEARMTKVLDRDKQYKGEVAVLLDSNSASASEVTARFLQIEKRARIYGDYSSGSVMTSIWVPFRSVFGPLWNSALIRVGMSVTVADVIMSDGSRLEKTGVVPDQVVVPTGEALKTKMDPVLAYAAFTFGSQLTSEQAGKFHFIAEKDEDEDEQEAPKDE